MSYAVKDVSIASGAPILCYKFVAEFRTWRLTSYNDSVVLGGEIYLPAQVRHTAVEISGSMDSIMTIDVGIPADHEIARAFCFLSSPKELKVTIYRAHEGDDLSTDFRIEWAGYHVGSRAEGKEAILLTGSIIQAAMNGNLSTVYYQKICNHVLFDERCKVVRASFTDTAVVTKIQGQLITIDVPPYADHDLQAGQMTNTRTGEQQGIIDNQTDKVSLGYRFFDLIVGDTVELTLGCNHLRLGHCKNRFNNVINYGGMDFIPEQNPFERLKLQTTVNTTNTVRKITFDGLTGANSVQS